MDFRSRKDKDIKFVTITGCDITSDLSYAKVYYTVLDETKKESTKKALEKAKGFIRGEISKRIDIRHTPELRFIFDTSEEYGSNIGEKQPEGNNERRAHHGYDVADGDGTHFFDLERGEEVIGVRRDIARVNLVLRERELAESK